jgi:uncharacterized protein YceK
MTRILKSILSSVILLVSLTGCATFDSISKADATTAKVFSGTRLDVRALAGEVHPDRRFRVFPPQYPLLDLPFSFLLDLIILPSTCGVALYEVIFG